MTAPDAQTYKYYLEDLGLLLKECALRAKQDWQQHQHSEDQSFYDGQLSAYYRVISLMQQQAKGFGIPLEEINLHDIEPDRDLV